MIHHTQLPQPEGWSESKFWIMAIVRLCQILHSLLVLFVLVVLFSLGFIALRHWITGGAAQ